MESETRWAVNSEFLFVENLPFVIYLFVGQECFGLLGVNGAGKTTTFRMLTGDEIMSR